jgi:hypothetical protein
VTLNLPGFPALARAVAGVLIGGVVTAIVFLICAQGSFRQGITDFDYAHMLGTAIEGTATEESGAEALGVIGDSAGPTALWTTIIAGIVLLAFHALVVARFVRRGWVIKGIALGIVAFIAIGVIYIPYVDARLDTPVGPWGVDQGGMTPLVFLGSSLIACIAGARCYDLAERASWWEEEKVAVDEQLAELTLVDESLELPEQGPKQGAIRP